MEVLNQNQRRSAVWRMVLLCGFILAVLGLIMFSAYTNYAASGTSELLELDEKMKKERNLWEGESQQFKNTTNNLNKELKECKANATKPDKKLEQCQQRLEGKDDRIEELTEELETCEAKLKTAESY